MTQLITSNQSANGSDDDSANQQQNSNSSHPHQNGSPKQHPIAADLSADLCARPKVDHLTDHLDGSKNYSKPLQISLHHPSQKNGSISSNGSYANSESKNVTIEDIIGSFGWFQLLILIFSGIRECTLSYDAVIMSVVLQPETDFTCSNIEKQFHSFQDSMQLQNNATLSSLVAPDQTQCFIGSWIEGDADLMITNSTTHMIPCNEWTYPHKSTSKSMIAKWDLVCQNHWLIAVVESVFFIGLLMGELIWGYTADLFGRRTSYLLSHLVSLVFGWLAIFAPNLWILAACRFFVAAGNTGNYVLCSLQMELIGTKYRSFSTMLYHVGWGIGLVLVPVVYHLLDDYHMILAVTPTILLLLIPGVLWLPESPRWLMATKGDFTAARYELNRGAKLNGKAKNKDKLEKQIAIMEQRILAETRARKDSLGDDGGSQRSGGYQEPFSTLFTNRTYLKDTLILCYLMSMVNTYYFYLTTNFAYVKNLSLEANFITSAIGEWVACIIGASMLRFVRRKTMLTIVGTVLGLSFVVQAIIDSEKVISSDVIDLSIVVATNNAIGTVASVSMVFILMIVCQEVYPTTLRQRGAGFVGTMMGFGSCLAPPLVQLMKHMDDWRMNIILVLPCLFGAFFSYFITVTDDSDLQDT